MITIFDFIILTILALFSLRGLYKGLIHIIIYFTGFIASIICAIFLYPYMDILVEKYVHNGVLAGVVGGIISYFLSFLFFTCISAIVASFFRVISKGFFDRICGFVVGAIKGMVIIILIFAVSAILTSGTYQEADNVPAMIQKLESEKYPTWLQESITAPYLEHVLKNIVIYVPLTWFDYFQTDKEKQNESNYQEEAVHIQKNINIMRGRMQKFPAIKRILRYTYR